MILTFSHTPDQITLTVAQQRAGLLDRLRAKKPTDLTHLPPDERKLALAIADLRALADELGDDLRIEADRIQFGHRLAAALDGDTADRLGLPPLTDLVLRTDVEGIVGEPEFRLRLEWLRAGVRKLPRRTGAILETDRGVQRIPLWMMEALDVAEAHRPGEGDAADWEALARFRRALDPGVTEAGAGRAARLSLTDFLSGLEVGLADRFSISPDASGTDFEVVPFSGRRIDDIDSVPESMAELGGAELGDFQRKLRGRGALNAFRLGPGKFLVIDRAAAPVLQVMAEMQRAPREERAAFIRNPRPRITGAIEAALEARGELADLDDAGREESVERAAGPVLVETAEYAAFSARVTGIEVFEAPTLDLFESSGTTWLPEVFTFEVARQISALPVEGLESLAADLAQAIEAGTESVPSGDVQVPATPETLAAVQGQIAARRAEGGAGDIADAEPEEGPSGPLVLQTADNFEELHWRPTTPPRTPAIPLRLPQSLVTPLKEHQIDSFDWQGHAWAAGLPGVLNADEQGLGKTLQTIAFLVWLNEHMAESTKCRGPILIVAPTSLLQNWEQEVARHVGRPGLGHLIRLYGSAIGARRKAGQRGMDTQTGEALLDFSDLERAAKAGAGHLTWVLTTYTTLTNYQHSLARIPFAAAVFDEIQAIKNPASLRAAAARAMKADFRIGLTGTPIENSAVDLWAIMDQLAPGALGTLRDFRNRYAVPDETNMAELHGRVFAAQGDLPPLALRRLKETVARDLPTKTRVLVPLEMPAAQARVYDMARMQLATGGKGAGLKLLHHIRTVSVHPALDEATSDVDFIAASARLSATFGILRRIKESRERALVFIEHRQMQYRFIELARAEFGLDQIDLINSETPIQKRQQIVNRFQANLEEEGNFDLLVLGPKAAGTGLTLTAATHVIHLSRWWNPAVEEQCNDRVHRLGQTRPVRIHVPMAIHPSYRAHSFDCLLHSLMQRKRKLANSALWPTGDTQDDAEQLREMLAQEAVRHGAGDSVKDAMVETFARDGTSCPHPGPGGTYVFS
ncbi:DEAD/DEAH box helicase [Rhodovulum marinum]|uniref:Helicase-like protein n=1 Tax=Rhodovulum marinum TaxID=320662 RepID=A0A4R2PSA2_9RHOB|nr:DEAD/DEAH box helicase [Rhodovulum marinum]TCP38802.1 helicase-like protein [Rhodovulum marinum]